MRYNNYFAQTIELLLHVEIKVQNFEAINLPIYLKNTYDFSIFRLEKIKMLAAIPKEPVTLTALRKQRCQLIKTTGLECVFCFKNIRSYTKKKMIEEGISFIIKDKDVYLPFLGIALNSEAERRVKIAKTISFSTQKLLLTALYKRWNRINLSDTANLLNVSKMTVTRSFDELETLGLPFVCKTKKERSFIQNQSQKAYWNLIYPYLRYPVFKEYRLDTNSNYNLPLGGISALSQYSMLSDNAYPTYAIDRRDASDLFLNKELQLPEDEQPAVLIQIMYYMIFFGKDKAAIDPITAYLTLKEEERQDPRIELAWEEIMEEYIYGSRT